MRVQVVFLEEVPPRYQAGDVRAVLGGYARNFLFPQGLAVPATPEQLKRIERIKKAATVQREKDIEGLGGINQELDGLVVKLRARAGGNGQLYGSITSLHIASEVQQATGREVSRRMIVLPQPIKEVGTFQIPVRLHSAVVPTLTVIVEPEGQLTRTESPSELDNTTAAMQIEQFDTSAEIPEDGNPEIDVVSPTEELSEDGPDNEDEI